MRKSTFHFLENLEDGHKIYESVLVDPKNIDILRNTLALDIINKLSTDKLCAMDLSRELKQHEQKIYYHIKRLEEAGIIKHVSSEKRYGMTAKLYSAKCPIVATKVFDGGQVFDKDNKIGINPKLSNFLSPFVENGKFNSQVIIGDTYSHGRFDAGATESAHIFDLAMMFGRFVTNLDFPNYRLDTETTVNDLKDINVILIGNARTNMIIDKINPQLPVVFDPEKGRHIRSTATNKEYDDARIGLILKIDSPLNPEKKILLIGGTRTRGTQSAIIAFTKHTNKLIELEDSNGNMIAIVQGLDKDGDKILDSVKFLEPGEA